MHSRDNTFTFHHLLLPGIFEITMRWDGEHIPKDTMRSKTEKLQFCNLSRLFFLRVLVQIHSSFTANMDKYRRVPKEKTEREAIGQNEIRVVATSQRSTRNYISYAINLFSAEVCFYSSLVFISSNRLAFFFCLDKNGGQMPWCFVVLITFVQSQAAF